MMGLIDTDSVITIQSFDDGKYTEKQITVGEFIKQYTKKGEVPYVDPVRHGHWVVLQDCANSGVYCSECQTKIFDRYPIKKKLSQYCGHCGAKMDEEIVNDQR